MYKPNGSTKKKTKKRKKKLKQQDKNKLNQQYNIFFISFHIICFRNQKRQTKDCAQDSGATKHL